MSPQSRMHWPYPITFHDILETIDGVLPPMTITITEKAAAEMQRVLKEHNLPDGTVLRVGVAGGGCSGFQYSLGFDKQTDPETDVTCEQHGITVAVDKRSVMFLEGTTIDYYDSVEKRGFTFDNPNVAGSCGQGDSFSV